MTEAPTALLPPGTTLGLWCGGAALVTCGLPVVSLVFGALGLLNVWRSRRAVRREPTVYRESGLRIVTRGMILTAWVIAALVALGGHTPTLPLAPTDLW